MCEDWHWHFLAHQFSSVTGKRCTPPHGDTVLLSHGTDYHSHRQRQTSNHDLTKSEALTHQAAGGHVLLRLDLTEVQGAGENQHVYHHHETGQESDGRLRGHALCCLDVL